MTSTIVPPVDLAPGMPSRVVRISATDVTEGGKSMAGETVTFALSDSLDASGGVVIAKTQATITLDSDGNGRIRVPVYTPDAKTWGGSSDWAVLVSASWGSQKAVRVPSGSGTIALSALPNVRPLTWEEMQWAVTGAGITIVEGSQWGATVSLDNGVLKFVLTVPPGGTAWWKGMLGTSADIDTLEDGAYGFFTGAAAGEVGMPEALTGVLESYQTAGVQIFNVRTTGEQRTWQRSRFSSGWTGWQRVDAGSWYKGNLDEQTGTLATLDAGLYLVRYVATAEAWGLPQRLLGQLEVVDAGTQRRITFAPNDAGAGWGDKALWEIATNSNGVLRDRWQRTDKSIMRTAPVVLTSPAGDYPQADSRGAVRLPFTVPTTIGKVRVHMRPWNFRTREEWGPARLGGVMIAQQNSGGTITGSRWYAPNVDGQTVSGSEEWVSDWFYVGLTPGNTYLLSYAAEWQDTSRNLVSGQCWSNFDLDKWDTTEPAIYQNGWGGFTLNPMDVWIECEAPSDVPVWGYIESSNGVFAGANSVFGAYPNVHARKNGAFAAVTAAGGWSPMDETFHDSAIINRFGYPARMLDRMYLSMGANIEARGASAQDAIAELERWMNSKPNSLGNPPIYLLTQISRYTSDGTEDTAGTLSEWNEWIRYGATQRDDVAGLIDQAAIFQDPEKPWTARVELRNSPTDVHFGAMGQKLRAQALDGEVHLPMLTQKNADDLPWRVGFEWAGEPHASESIKYVGGREVARNLIPNPNFESGVAGVTGSSILSMERTNYPASVEHGSWALWPLVTESSTALTYVLQEVAIPPGAAYVAGRAMVRATSGAAARARLRVSFGGGGTRLYEWVSDLTDVRGGQHVLHGAVEIPSGYTSVQFMLYLYGVSAELTEGSRFATDGWMLTAAETRDRALEGVRDYFDGDTAGWDRLDRLDTSMNGLLTAYLAARGE